MTAVQTAAPPAPATVRRSPLLLTAGVALTVSGLWSVADELDSRLVRDIADTAYFKAFALTSLVAFALLTVAVGALLARGAAGRRPVVAVVAAAGLLQAVCAHWYIAFVTPLLAEVAPDSVNSEEGWLGLGLAVALLSAAVALVVVGLAVLREGALPRAAGWLLVVAGAALVIAPGGHLVAGAALLVAWRGR